MTQATDNGGQAFPSEQGFDPDGMWNQSYDPGMSLRDYFAGQALVGIGNWCPNAPRGESAISFSQPHRVSALRAEWAYKQADAMLAARKGGAA